MRSFGYYVRSFRTNVWSSMANVWSGFRKMASYCVVVNDRSLGIMRISGDGGGRPCAVFRRSVHTFVPKLRTFPLELRTFIQGIRMTARCRALPRVAAASAHGRGASRMLRVRKFTASGEHSRRIGRMMAR